MWWLKTCPRCGGDVYVEPGRRSWAEECLQCGYVREHETPLVAGVSAKAPGRLSFRLELEKVAALSTP